MATKPQELNRTYIMIATILGLSILGYALINNSYKERAELREIERENSRKYQLTTCLAGVEKDYRGSWNDSCKSRGLANECSLPTYEADNIEDSRKNGNENCFKYYPSN